MFFADICSLGVLREQLLHNLVSPYNRGLLHKQYRVDMHIFMYIFKKRGLIYYLVVPICLEDVYHNIFEVLA